MTGKRELQKTYFSHSGYPGAGKTISFAQMMAKKPEFVIEKAVKKYREVIAQRIKNSKM